MHISKKEENCNTLEKEKGIYETRKRINAINTNVQQTLRKAVIRLGWSDTQVAKNAGHPQSTVYRLLNARTANPPFALVYEVCQTLGIPLPLSNSNESALTLPISLYIGISDACQKEVEYIHVTPELRTLKVCKVMDDCADRLYPKGSLLFISEDKERLQQLKQKDIAIVDIFDAKEKLNSIIPMMVMAKPNENEWVLHHFSENRKKQFTFSIDVETLSGVSENRTIKIIGLVQKALI